VSCLKICLSIMVEDLPIIVDQLPDENIMIEIRLDNGLNRLDDIQDVISRFRKRLILTIRTKKEGGFYTGTSKELYENYLKIIKLNPSYIDVEIMSKVFEKVARIARDSSVKVIASYHNPMRTPPSIELEKIINIAMHSPYVDVIKIVTMAQKYEDNLTILELLTQYSERHPLIAFCMGRLGRISRIAAPLFGSWLTYTSINRDGTAPGQIPLDRMIEILRWLA